MPEFICKACSAPFRADNLTGGRPRTYCSRKCMSVDYRSRMIGSDNPAWRGKKWGYKGVQWKAVCAEIIARDGGCADCGTTEKLVVHHLIPQRFWLDLARANVPSNLLTLCSSCHVKRPEHFWVEMPDSHFDAALHSRLPPERFRARLKPKPLCAVCGAPCREHRNRFCSYSCSQRARWRDGIYDGAAIARNITRTRWQVG